MKRIALPGLLVMAALIAVTGTLLGTPADTPAVAQVTTQETTDEDTAFVGVASAVTDELLVLETATGPVSILLTADYDLRTPGSAETAGMLDVGARVVVLASKSDLDEWEAKIVLVKPVAPTFEPITGAVVNVEGGVITIVRPDGTVIMVELPENAQGPALAQVVTAFRNREQAIPGSPSPATGIVTAEQVRERLRLQINQLLVDDPLRTQAQEQIRARQLEKLAVALEQHERERLRVLQQMCDKSCDGQPVAVANAVRNQIQTVQQQQIDNASQIAAANGKSEEIKNQSGGAGSGGSNSGDSGQNGGGSQGGGN